jgi:hypothetical protein
MPAGSIGRIVFGFRIFFEARSIRWRPVWIRSSPGSVGWFVWQQFARSEASLAAVRRRSFSTSAAGSSSSSTWTSKTPLMKFIDK